jgi:D-alanine-D-alanine ligase
MIKKYKIVLLSGGVSPEREISLRSSTSIAAAITQLGHELFIVDPADFPTIDAMIIHLKSLKFDLVFIGLHGGDGENGMLQYKLEKANIPFTGSTTFGCSTAMHKDISYNFCLLCDVTHPSTSVYEKNQKPIETKLPLIVKPNSAGSSVGTHIIRDIAELEPAMLDAFRYDKKVLVQTFISGRELAVGILGDLVLPVVEIKPRDGFYDYTNKYTSGRTEYICPAPLTPEETKTVSDIAKYMFLKIGCQIYGRVDFIYDGDKFYFLEVNTLPGMTELSLVPMAARTAGIDFESLIQKILDLSVARS